MRAVIAPGIDAERWTSRDRIEAMTVVNHQLGRDAMPGGQMRDPLAWFVSTARFAVRYAEISGWESSSARARRITDESLRLREQQEAAGRAEAERVASIDRDEIDAAIAEMHRLFPKPLAAPRRWSVRSSRQQRGVAIIEHGDLAWMRHLTPVERAELEAQVRALWTAGNDAAATDLLEAREATLVLPAPVKLPDRPRAG